jgi:hypothetical protein
MAACKPAAVDAARTATDVHNAEKEDTEEVVVSPCLKSARFRDGLEVPTEARIANRASEHANVENENKSQANEVTVDPHVVSLLVEPEVPVACICPDLFKYCLPSSHWNQHFMLRHVMNGQ